MNLKMVTWEGDLTQFIVDVSNEPDEDGARKKAILKAIDANFKICEPDDEIIEDMKDPETYTVEDIDFNLLNEIFLRNDCMGMYGEAIVFSN